MNIFKYKYLKIKLKIKDKLEDLVYNLDDFWRTLKAIPTKLRRSWDYAIFGYNNLDFDYQYLMELILFKLERMEKVFLEGYHDPESDSYKQKMKSIKLAIKLLKKLETNSYNRFYDLHQKTYGRLIYKFIPIDKNGKRVKKRYAKYFALEAESEMTKEARKSFLESSKKDENERRRDLKLVCDIIAKHSNSWWD